MKNFTRLAFVALLSISLVGCGNTEEKKEDKKETANASATTPVSLDADSCEGQCGSEDSASDCCQSDKCEGCSEAPKTSAKDDDHDHDHEHGDKDGDGHDHEHGDKDGDGHDHDEKK